MIFISTGKNVSGRLFSLQPPPSVPFQDEWFWSGEGVGNNSCSTPCGPSCIVKQQRLECREWVGNQIFHSSEGSTGVWTPAHFSLQGLQTEKGAGSSGQTVNRRDYSCAPWGFFIVGWSPSLEVTGAFSYGSIPPFLGGIKSWEMCRLFILPGQTVPGMISITRRAVALQVEMECLYRV